MKIMLLIKHLQSVLSGAFILLFILFAIGPGCKKNDNNITTGTKYVQVSLVSDTNGFGAARVDPLLVNAWGFAIGPAGDFWISANGTGLTSIYDRNGTQLSSAITIPFGSGHASPCGVIYNNTGSFVIPSKGAASYIYCTEDGILSAWSSGTGISCVTVADQSASNTVYKGLAMANDGTGNFLCVADFHHARVDVYDSAFNLVHNKPFTDANIPAGFAPFNIQNVNGQLYVTYAKQNALLHDDIAAPGNGYIDIFTTSGVLVSRFASNGTLNSPWGIAQASSGFGQAANAILVGNFGDGAINVFSNSGSYLGQLKDSVGNVIAIDGLWGIGYTPTGNQNQLFFAAGPKGETHGLFGYIGVRP